MKNGDFVIAPINCAEYLTAGKKYQAFERVNFDGNSYFKIKNDMNDESSCSLKHCEHLNGQDWILATESEAFLKEVEPTRTTLGENLTMGSESFYVNCNSGKVFVNIGNEPYVPTYKLNVDKVDTNNYSPISEFLEKNGFGFVEKGVYHNEKAKVILYDDYYAVMNFEDNGINYSDNLNIYWLIGYLTYYNLINKEYKI